MENSAINTEITVDFSKIYDNLDTTINKCPVCGEQIIPQGRCRTCENCYWSACEI